MRQSGVVGRGKSVVRPMLREQGGLGLPYGNHDGLDYWRRVSQRMFGTVGLSGSAVSSEVTQGVTAAGSVWRSGKPKDLGICTAAGTSSAAGGKLCFAR